MEGRGRQGMWEIADGRASAMVVVVVVVNRNHQRSHEKQAQ